MKKGKIANITLEPITEYVFLSFTEKKEIKVGLSKHK